MLLTQDVAHIVKNQTWIDGSWRRSEATSLTQGLSAGGRATGRLGGGQ
jgi:hypothetical protein